jgi:hypothetical protein
LSGVTNEILKSGNFTVPAIKRILEQNLAKGQRSNLTKREIDELIVTLRQELGLEPAKDHLRFVRFNPFKSMDLIFFSFHVKNNELLKNSNITAVKKESNKFNPEFSYKKN